jgi:hypothetical protein
MAQQAIRPGSRGRTGGDAMLTAEPQIIQKLLNLAKMAGIVKVTLDSYGRQNGNTYVYSIRIMIDTTKSGLDAVQNILSALEAGYEGDEAKIIANLASLEIHESGVVTLQLMAKIVMKQKEAMLHAA